MQYLGQDPVPAYLKNLNTGELKGFFLNPEQLRTQIQAVYSEREILGSPNAPMDYERTKNQEFTFKLVWSATHIQVEGKVPRSRALQEIKDWRAYLTSLLKPVETKHKNWRGGDPPMVWFYWPNVVSLQGRVESVSWSLNLFDLNLNSIYEMATVKFKAETAYPIYSEDARLLGWEIQV